VAQILEDPDRLSLGGEERIVTVLFSDVAGFTTFSEKLTPAELVNLLNEYLTEMSEIVLANDGIIDKFEGDAIMAEFGVPVPFDNHAAMACKTALEMQNRLAVLREEWGREGKPMLEARVGINTGDVIVGNLGSRNVFDYTVVGDAVNLGSRLEGANKYYGTRVMISEFTYELVKEDFHTRMLDVIRVKGKEEPIGVYELIAFGDEVLPEDRVRHLEQFQRGVELYRGRDWNGAEACFRRCLDLDENDESAREYLRRCEGFKNYPPGEDWDGVTVLTEK
jgi:adenylate cyclase